MYPAFIAFFFLSYFLLSLLQRPADANAGVGAGGWEGPPSPGVVRRLASDRDSVVACVLSLFLLGEISLVTRRIVIGVSPPLNYTDYNKTYICIYTIYLLHISEELYRMTRVIDKEKPEYLGEHVWIPSKVLARHIGCLSTSQLQCSQWNLIALARRSWP